MIHPEQRQLIKQLLTPSLICDHIEDIPLHLLFNRGYEQLLLDLDNTILSPRHRDISLRCLNWVNKAQAIGFSVHIVSNNGDAYRVERAAKQLGITALYHAKKPFAGALRHYAQHHGISLKSSVLVGDQLVTDVLVANWVRAYSILVQPLDPQLSIFKTIQKDLESWLLATVSSR